MASEKPKVRTTETENSQQRIEHKTLGETYSCVSMAINKMQPNDANTEASANTACNTEMLKKEPEDKATDTAELRPRIESFNTQPKARKPSFLGESEKSQDIHNRTGSVGAARRPSFIKGQGESNNQQAVDGRPARNYKRRIKAINKPPDQDTNGATSMTDNMVPENQNKNPVNVESSTATGDEYLRINNKTADPDTNKNELSEHLRHDSSSSSESICQSGGSMSSSVSSYDADPEFPLSQTEVSDNQSSVQPS